MFKVHQGRIVWCKLCCVAPTDYRRAVRYCSEKHIFFWSFKTICSLYGAHMNMIAFCHIKISSFDIIQGFSCIKNPFFLSETHPILATLIIVLIKNLLMRCRYCLILLFHHPSSSDFSSFVWGPTHSILVLSIFFSPPTRVPSFPSNPSRALWLENLRSQSGGL